MIQLMKNTLKTLCMVVGFLAATFAYWILLFATQRAVFLAINSSKAIDAPLGELVLAFIHGLRFDISIWGYGSIFSLVVFLVAVWLCDLRKVVRGMGIVLGALGGLFTFLLPANSIAYNSWGHHADAAALGMLADSPELLFASMETQYEMIYLVVCGLMAVVFGVLLSKMLNPVRKIMRRDDEDQDCALSLRGKCVMAGIIASLAGLSIIPIRGGLGLAPLNTGMAYFSQVQFANHTAVNPIWNFLYSTKRAKSAEVRYDFMPDEDMEGRFSDMMRQDGEPAKILKSERPNVVIILLESFSAHGIRFLGGENATPCLDALTREGVYFDNVFASSDRSGKGLVAVMCGYPSLPTVRVIQFPQKTQNISFLAQKLRDNGYESQTFVYGGDINFNNFNSLVNQAGFDNIITENDFSHDQLGDKWGAHDEHTFAKLLETMDGQKEPFFNFFFTLSSHEPYTVPMERKMSDDYLNSMYYTDHCLGQFFEQAKTKSWWDNTLFVLIADHGHQGPSRVGNTDRRRFNIPLILTGGAVAVRDSLVHTYGTQTDLANTLLSQMGIDASDFNFSRNLLIDDGKDFAFFDFTDGYGYVTKEDYQVYDIPMSSFIRHDNQTAEADTTSGRAYLQKIAKDFQSR